MHTLSRQFREKSVKRAINYSSNLTVYACTEVQLFSSVNGKTLGLRSAGLSSHTEEKEVFSVNIEIKGNNSAFWSISLIV